MQKDNICKYVFSDKGCFGCGACKNICPIDAIDMGYDNDGYLIPVANNEICVECGKCKKICPILNEIRSRHFENDEIVSFAAWAPLEIRMGCSSGGAAPVFTDYVINKGGIVYGTVWNDDFSCSIRGTTLSSETEKQRFSKYLQSNTELTFREVKRQIEDGKQVLYFGTPCQIAGLNSFLGDLCYSENLITVDLLCSHSPSGLLFKRYISENYSKVKKVIFRPKRDIGWTCDGHTIEMSNGKKIICMQSSDPYQMAYHGFIMRRKICEECPYADFPRQGDITIGDFWGVACEDPSWDDHNGTSLIIANSLKGLSFIRKTTTKFDRIEEVPIKWARNKGNRIGNDCRKGHKNALYFTRLLKKNTFKKAVYSALSDKHDIGLICYSNRNYGNNLTNYALYRFLNECGLSVLMINTAKDSFFNQDIYFGEGFIENPYYKEDLSDRLDNAEYIKYNDCCDFFCVGSDQLFRESFVKGMEYASLLKFAYSYKFKFSYGTSFGNSLYNDDELLKNRMSYLLSRFDAISVREKTGLDILKEVFGINNAKQVVDPVFLVDSKIFNDMANISNMGVGKEYIGAYFLDPDRFKEEFLSNIVNGRKLEEKVILDRETHAYKEYRGSLNVIDNPNVEDWLALIRNSNIFITDSFHGVCFALIFQKDFYVLFHRDNWRGIDRISGLLKELDLLDRLIIIGENEIIENKSIDYNSIKIRIESKAAQSREWLSEILEMANKHKGKSDAYDIFIEESFINMQKSKKNEKQIYKLKSELFFLNNKVCQKKEDGNLAMKKKIIGFGIGNCLERNIEKVLEYCNISYLTDNNPEKWGREFWGIKCISPSEVAGLTNVEVLIFVDDVAISFDIAKQLMNMNIYSFNHVNNYLKDVYDKDIL